MRCYPWQEKQWAYLYQAYHQSRFPHALLLAGERGLGQSDFAKNVSHFLLCESPQEEACGGCRSCHLFAQSSHPDYYEIVENIEAITVDRIRDLLPALVQKSHFNRGVKVVFISLAERMNRSACNALLKILEEPYDKTYFILETHHQGLLLPTIKSRCQHLHFFSDKALSRSFLLSLAYDASLVDKVLCLWGRNPLEAKKWLDSPEIFTKYAEIGQDLLVLISTDIYPQEIYQRWRQIALSDLLDCLIVWISQELQTTMTDLSDSSLGSQTNKPTVTQWLHYYDEVCQVRKLMLEGYNLNKDLVLDTLVALFLERV
jgi:DNA polymerase III subunit delta'